MLDNICCAIRDTDTFNPDTPPTNRKADHSAEIIWTDMFGVNIFVYTSYTAKCRYIFLLLTSPNGMEITSLLCFIVKNNSMWAK